jgi:hypothetical protein
MNHESTQLLANDRIADMRREAAIERLVRMAARTPSPAFPRRSLRGILGRLAHAT